MDIIISWPKDNQHVIVPSTAINVTDQSLRPLTWAHVSKEDILKLEAKIENSFARDIYTNFKNLLKQSITGILESLTKYTNDVSNSGIFLETLELFKLIPTYKKGSGGDPSSYRPIYYSNIW